MEIPFALPGDEFARMARAVRKVEGLPPRREQQGRRGFYPSDSAHTWIKVTSATGSTVTLGGGTVTGYAAVWGYFDASGAGFTWTTNTAWFVPSPGSGAPVVNQTFECRLLGMDSSGVPIWGAVIFAPAQVPIVIQIQSSTSTTVNLSGGSIQAFSAKIFSWNNATGWSTTGVSCWFYPLDTAKTPPVGRLMLVQFQGVDNSNTGIYSDNIFEDFATGNLPFSDFTLSSTSIQNITGFTMTMPSGGQWVVSGMMSATLTTTSIASPGPTALGVSLSYSPAPTSTNNNGQAFVCAPLVANVATFGTAPIFQLVKTAGSTTIQVQATIFNGTNFGSGTVYGPASTGSSYIAAKRIA